MLRLLLLGFSITVPTLALAGFEATPIGKVRVGAAAVELHATDDMVAADSTEPRKLSGQDGLLRAVATVIQGPPHDTRVAIVALDIIAIERKYLDAAAKEIEQKTSIPFDHIVINCTHTHQVPSTTTVFGYDPVPGFVTQVKSAVVEAVVQANKRLASSPPIRMLFVMGHEDIVGQNSRYEMRDGTIGYPPFPVEDQLGPTVARRALRSIGEWLSVTSGEEARSLDRGVGMKEMSQMFVIIRPARKPRCLKHNRRG